MRRRRYQHATLIDIKIGFQIAITEWVEVGRAKNTRRLEWQSRIKAGGVRCRPRSLLLPRGRGRKVLGVMRGRGGKTPLRAGLLFELLQQRVEMRRRVEVDRLFDQLAR